MDDPHLLRPLSLVSSSTEKGPQIFRAGNPREIQAGNSKNSQSVSWIPRLPSSPRPHELMIITKDWHGQSLSHTVGCYENGLELPTCEEGLHCAGPISHESCSWLLQKFTRGSDFALTPTALHGLSKVPTRSRPRNTADIGYSQEGARENCCSVPHHPYQYDAHPIRA